MAKEERGGAEAPREAHNMEDRPSSSRHRGTEITNEELEEELELIYGAKHVIMIFVPVGICMLFVVVTINSVKFFSTDDGEYLVYTPFHPAADDTGARTLVKSLLNALIIASVVVVMTFFLVLLYKYRCYGIIHGWIIMSSVMLLFMFGFVYLQELLKAYIIPMDLPTIVFSLYNFGATGIFVIHWKGPLHLQQAYLILSASLMSLIFIKYLPEWTLWVVLGMLAIWDLIAVLAPHGPLKMLVELSSERGEQVMPALIYSSTVMYPVVTMAKRAKDRKKAKDKTPSSNPGSIEQMSTQTSETTEATPGPSREISGQVLPAVDEEVALVRNPDEEVAVVRNPDTVDIEVRDSDVDGKNAAGGDTAASEHRRTSERIAHLEQEIEEAEEKGVKLGLGDFIFYSVLVGKASASREPMTTIACFIAILMGLFLTLAILVTAKRALPALPISILFGLLFNFGTSYMIAPMLEDMTSHQIFV